MSLIQNPTQENQMHVITLGDGKNAPAHDGMRTVKIPEKREGKGKGKTIAYVSIPTVQYPLGSDEELSLRPMVLELLASLQDEIIVAKQREGATSVLQDQISVAECVNWWAQKNFSAETVGNWFDGEVAELLMAAVVTAKGWQEKDLEDNAKLEFLQQKLNAYRASYVACAQKFPGLNPSQVQELLRVIELLELNGPIVQRIKDKITPKNVETELGF